MIIIGAKGFAKHSLQVLFDNNDIDKEIFFFDNVTLDGSKTVYGKYKIISSFEKLVNVIKTQSPEFILGVGGSLVRKTLYEKIENLGGIPTSLISKSSSVGHFNVTLGSGLNVMEYAIIEVDTVVGRGSLINMYAVISHDVQIGEFCEISPGAKLLGRVTVGDHTEIGSNAVILPDVKIGSNVRIGAGAVVTKDIQDNSVVVGIPARPIEYHK